MATTPILTATGTKHGSMELADALFAAAIDEGLVYQAVLRQLAGRRTGTADTLTRGQVAGGGHKPWRQKGTGRARQGTKSAPHWKGGGVVFGPHPRAYDIKLNAKVRRAALKAALSSRVAEGAIRVVESFGMETIGTKTLLDRLAAWKAEGKVLLVLAARDEVVERSCRNLREVRVILADSLNVVDLLQADTIVFTRAAVERAQDVYA